LKEGEPFNYYTLRDNLADINQYPDHYAKAVLVPGQQPETTDVLIEVKDRLPVHLDLSYDNFASKYIGKNEYTATLRDNNLLGFDDILALSYEGSNDYAYRLGSISYLAPVTNRTQIGVAASKNRVVLQKDLKAINAQGKSKLYSAFINQTLVEGANLKITANGGFDYKDVFNFELNNEVSRDRLRIVKSGFNIYYNDAFAGRNIFADEFFQGIPDIMAGSRAKDPQSSVVGAGGKFSKDVVDFLRLQQLPWDTSLLFKSEAQFTSDILPAIEEYQLGGIANNRGFGPLEAVGDTGQSLSTELNVPLYFIPTSVKVPFSTVSLYDATRFVAFYDWGHVNLRNPQAGEPKNRSLGSAGCGVRFDLPENFSLRVEIGWPVQGVPTSDHRHAHLWLQVIKEF
ncbi:MAG: ShlB/FhaC/HecB family hemolysin secretion/activation protein, partial [Candidatus Omnitrophica bacterium]|nr:ShlB/FhaC/HecB family hemolysin secretion/activation protein [Candidatus Omnitrophota bacterium]